MEAQNKTIVKSPIVSEECYKKKSADEIFKENLAKVSDEQKKKDIAEKQPGKITILFRHIKNRKDIVLLVSVGIVFTIFGCCLYSLKTAFSIQSLFVTTFVFLAGTAMMIWKIYTPPSKFTQFLIQSGNKDPEQLDPITQRTIIGKP